jgi:predicted amidohydrolase
MQPLKLCLMQAQTRWHDPAGNRQLLAKWFDELSDEVDVVVLPEMFSTGFTMACAEVFETMQGETVSWLKDEADHQNRVICGSMVIKDGGSYYNRFLWVQPDGVVHSYDKRHCFRMGGEHKHYTAGSRRAVFEWRDWRICPMICYDLRFPVFFRNREDYDAIICVANWPGVRRQAWNTLLRARAIENQVYAAGANVVGKDGNGVDYTGGSAGYGPDGSILGEVFNTPQLLMVDLDPEPLLELRKSFPVWQDADPFELQ